MEMSPVAVDILTNKTYSDPMGAFLREIATNACDANLENGHGDVPVNIQLPTTSDPTYLVRDHGRGLSIEDVTTCFCVFFKSTKRESNDQEGAMGLGCKSPFSYTDIFSVESYFNGVKYVYAMSKKEGMLECELIHQEKSDAPSGVCVKIPIKRQDINTFNEKASSVFGFFKVKPNFIGSFVPQLHVVEHFFKDIHKITKDCKPQQYSWYHRDPEPHVVVGNIGYVIDRQYQHNLQNTQYLPAGYVIKTDIGEIDLNSSRERPQWTRRTIDHLQKKIDECAAHIKEQISDEVKDIECLHDYVAWHATGDGRKYNHLIPSHFVPQVPKAKHGKSLDYSNHSTIKFRNLKLDERVWVGGSSLYIRRNEQTKTKIGNGWERFIEPITHVITLDKDIQNPVPKVTRWCKQNNISKESVVIIFSDDVANVIKNSDLHTDWEEKYSCHTYSELPIKKEASQKRSAYTLPSFYEFKVPSHYTSDVRNFWRTSVTTVNDGDTIPYVPIKSNRIVSKNVLHGVYPKELEAISEHFNIPTIFGIHSHRTKSIMKKFPELKFENVIDTVRTFVEDNLDHMKDSYYHHYHDNSSRYYAHERDRFKALVALDTEKKLTALDTLRNNDFLPVDFLESVSALRLEDLDFEVDSDYKPKKSCDFEKEIKKINEAYPVLNCVHHNLTDENLKELYKVLVSTYAVTE